MQKEHNLGSKYSIGQFFITTKKNMNIIHNNNNLNCN